MRRKNSRPAAICCGIPLEVLKLCGNHVGTKVWQRAVGKECADERTFTRSVGPCDDDQLLGGHVEN